MDDVERFLRDLYGDIDSSAIFEAKAAVFDILHCFTAIVANDIRQELEWANVLDRACEIKPPIGRARLLQWQDVDDALDSLKGRAGAVRASPSRFSHYTVEAKKSSMSIGVK